jgi:glutamyl-tRNA reductase
MTSADLVLVGLSYQTAPIEVREKVALSGEALRDLLRDLRHREGVAEAMIVSTCNRVEVYLVATSAVDARRVFTDRCSEAEGHLYEKRGVEAARHLFTVAASLDSMVLGEQQILGQVKEAYGVASAAATAGAQISRLCNHAFATAKRVRSETGIGKGASSVSQAAVELVGKIFGDLSGRTVLLVGTGKIGELSAKALADLEPGRLVATNRSPERAAALAAKVKAETCPFESLEDELALADVVLVSTGAPHFVITREMAERAMKARRQRSLCLIDLAVPRNIDPACAGLANLFAYDIDDLEKVVLATRESRAEEARRAGTIVEAELIEYARAKDLRAALPVLAHLRRRAQEVARAEAARTLALIGGKLDEKGRRSVEAMAQAIANKLLHEPTARLKAAASEGDFELPAAVSELFALELDSEGGIGRRAAVGERESA